MLCEDKVTGAPTTKTRVRPDVYLRKFCSLQKHLSDQHDVQLCILHVLTPLHLRPCFAHFCSCSNERRETYYKERWKEESETQRWTIVQSITRITSRLLSFTVLEAYFCVMRQRKWLRVAGMNLFYPRPFPERRVVWTSRTAAALPADSELQLDDVIFELRNM